MTPHLENENTKIITQYMCVTLVYINHHEKMTNEILESGGSKEKFSYLI
jgi:hypothetical protein